MSANNFTFPSADQTYEMIRANIVSPNRNQQLDSILSSVNIARTQLNSLISGASGLVDNIASLGSTLTTQLETIRTGVDSLLSDAQAPIRNLQSEIQSALITLQTTPNNFLAQMETIRSNFPSADIDSILNLISNGSINIAIDVPNIDISADGIEELRSIPSLIATSAGETIQELTTIPEITVPDIPDLNLQDISEVLVNSNNALQFSNTFVELGHRLASLNSRIESLN